MSKGDLVHKKLKALRALEEDKSPIARRKRNQIMAIDAASANRRDYVRLQSLCDDVLAWYFPRENDNIIDLTNNSIVVI